MATRTWRGSVSSLWSEAGNWLEGSVPVAGDDVVLDNGAVRDLYIDVTTATLRSFDASSYNRGIGGNGVLVVGSATITGTMFHGGSIANGCIWDGSGGLVVRLRSHSGNTSQNLIYGSNVTLSTVSFSLQYGSQASLVFASDFYCLDIIENLAVHQRIYWTVTSNSLSINIYGSCIRQGWDYIYLGQAYPYVLFRDINLAGTGMLSGFFVSNASYSFNLNVSGDYSLSGYFLYMNLGYDGTDSVITITGTISSPDGHDFVIEVSKQGYLNGGVVINCSGSVDNIVLLTRFNAYILVSSLNVNRRLVIMGRKYLPEISVARVAGYDANNRTINLGPDCDYLIGYCRIENLTFSRQVYCYYCSLTGCINIDNIAHPPLVVIRG